MYTYYAEYHPSYIKILRGELLRQNFPFKKHTRKADILDLESSRIMDMSSTITYTRPVRIFSSMRISEVTTFLSILTGLEHLFPSIGPLE